MADLNIDAMGVGEIAKLARGVIARIWPDPKDQAEHELKIAKLEQDGDLELLRLETTLLIKQAEANIEAARHKSIFVAGARPAILWVCFAGLGYQFVLFPLLSWLWVLLQALELIPLEICRQIADELVCKVVAAPPALDGSVLMAMTSAMLGVAGMRSFDASKGQKTNSLT